MAKKQKKWRFINIVIITLLALLTVLIALLSGFAANEPPPAVTPYLPPTQAAFRRFADHPTLPLALCELADHPTSPLPSLSSNDSRLLPCGHEKHRPDAHYCSVCGAPVPS